ncbi:unnamed protein product, partial [Rotaria sp. Silwood2]
MSIRRLRPIESSVISQSTYRLLIAKCQS